MTPEARPLPLADVRVLALEQYGAGPFASLHLADLGADVIKVEDPSIGGDVARSTPPFAQGGDSLFFQAFNRNKRSIALDLRSEAGRGLFEQLVGQVDVVFYNLRGDVPAKLGLTFDDLKEHNPRIVCCSLSGFGMTGPRRTEPAYDYLLQAHAGWMMLTGEPDGPPTRAGLSLVDFSGGMAAALAIVSAVHAARRDGIGSQCDVSLYDTAVGMLNYVATWHLTGGFEPRRTASSAHPSLVPFQTYRTADSSIVVGCAKEKFYRRLLEAFGDPAWGQDPRFGTFALRDEHREEVNAHIQQALLSRTTDEWMDILTAKGVPVAPVKDVATALRDPHTLARDLVVTTDHPVWGTVSSTATASRVGDQRPRPVAAPAMGAHTEEVLHGLLALSPSQIQDLADAGALGTTRE